MTQKEIDDLRDVVNNQLAIISAKLKLDTVAAQREPIQRLEDRIVIFEAINKISIHLKYLEADKDTIKSLAIAYANACFADVEQCRSQLDEARDMTRCGDMSAGAWGSCLEELSNNCLNDKKFHSLVYARLADLIEDEFDWANLGEWRKKEID